MNEKDKAEISADLNRMLMEMYERGIADAGIAATKAIEAAVLAEREECAKVCKELRHPNYAAESDDWIKGTEDCATAIRARGEK